MSSTAPTCHSESFFLDFFTQIYRYREYLKQSVLRDLRNKYKRSVLGYLWTVLHPLAMMTVLAVVFSQIMRIPVEDYAVFLFTGLIAWNYFHSTCLMSLHTIRANARLFGQIPVPKFIFVVSLALSNLTNLVFSLVPLVIIMLATGRPIGPAVLALPIVILPLLCIVMGVSLMLAASNVFFDDTLHLTEVGMQALYFLCPVLYQREHLPVWLVDWLALNPLFREIEFIRALFYSNLLPDPAAFGVTLCTSVLVLLVGLWTFHKVEDRFLYFV